MHVYMATYKPTLGHKIEYVLTIVVKYFKSHLHFNSGYLSMGFSCLI